MTYLPCTETVKTVPIEGRSVAETPFNIFQHTIHVDHRDNSASTVHRDNTAIVRTAKALCAGCPKRLACLEAGAGEHGVWGGTTSAERRALGLGGVA